MSKRRSIISILSILVVLIVGAFFIHSKYILFNSNSVNSSKDKSLRPYSEKLIRTHKLRRSFTISLTADQPTPILENTHFSIKSTFVVDAPLKNTRFTWKLPAGVEHVSGPLTGDLNLEVDDVLEINTQFLNKTSDNQILFLIISDETGNIHSEQFHTQNQDKIKSDLEELKNRQDEYIEKSVTPDEQ